MASVSCPWRSEHAAMWSADGGVLDELLPLESHGSGYWDTGSPLTHRWLKRKREKVNSGRPTENATSGHHRTVLRGRGSHLRGWGIRGSEMQVRGSKLDVTETRFLPPRTPGR